MGWGEEARRAVDAPRAVDETWTVANYTDNRQPYSAYPVCPACDMKGVSLAYRTTKAMRGNDAERYSVTEFGGGYDPHLVVTCIHCGFWWEMEVAKP